MKRRTFIVFDNKYSAEDGIRLLGRVVRDPRRPFDAYRPSIDTETTVPNTEPAGKKPGHTKENSSESHKDDGERRETLESNTFLNSFHLTTVSDNAPIFYAQSFESTKARLNITKLLALGVSSDQTTNVTYHAEISKVYELRQHEDVYKTLISQHEPELEALMNSQPSGVPLYMMVTLRTVENLRVLQDGKPSKPQDAIADSKKLGGAGTVPRGMPPGPGSVLIGNLGGKSARKTSRADALTMVAKGERAFAAEYCEIERTPKARFKLRKQEPPRASLRFKNGVSVFGGEHISFAPAPDNEKDGLAGEDGGAWEEVYK